MKNSFLQPVLDAGSSRLFHILLHTQRLTEEGKAASRLFFNTRSANKILVIKTPLAENTESKKNNDKPVRTKLFFPFNDKNLYEGGKTILVGDPNLPQALEEHWALSRQKNANDFDHDTKALALLDQLPSLDPFLMRDKFEIEKVDVNKEYFDVAPEELSSIQSFIREKMNIIAEFALGETVENKASVAVTQLTEKLWEAKDLKALGPVIGALRLPADSALESIYSWKGLIYYDFERTCRSSGWRDFAAWLAGANETRDGATRRQMQEMRNLLEESSKKMRLSYQVIKKELDTYRSAFERLFLKKESPDQFVHLLKDSRRIFWIVGDHMSRIDHCVSIWDQLSSRYPRRLMPYDPQMKLVEATIKLLG